MWKMYIYLMLLIDNNRLTASNIVEQILLENNIKVCLRETSILYLGDRRIEKIVTNLKEYKINMVVQAIDLTPNSKLGNKKLLRHLNCKSTFRKTKL